MGNIILLAETGADIPPAEVERHGIHIVPMHVSFGGETRDDGAFPPEEICAYYERTKELPKTSGSTPEDFQIAFDTIHARWPQARILYLAYSTVTTCSFQSAQIAAEGRAYVTSLDTKAVAAGQCSIVLGMARLLEEHPDWKMAQAVEAAEGLIRRSRMCFIPKDMKYLRAGGRVSNAVALCGDLLGIHPLIEIQDGHLVATQKLRGKLDKLVPRLVEEYTGKNNLCREELWLIRAPRLPENVQKAAERSAHHCGFRNVTWVNTGGVITTHGGPGAFGVAGFSQA